MKISNGNPNAMVYFTAVVSRSMLCSQEDIIVTFNNGENYAFETK